LNQGSNVAMSRRFTFETRARLGYVILAVMLAAGMGYAIHRSYVVADDQIARLRAEEDEITLVERLRWSSELLVSAGRGYLISGEPSLLTETRIDKSRFDDNLRALRDKSLTPTGLELVAAVQQAATEFQQVQQQLLDARQHGEASEVLVARFDTELLAHNRALDTALSRLVDYKERALSRVYERARAERARLAAWLYGLLAVLVVAGIVIASYFARLLGRSFRAEHAASEAAGRAVATRDEVMAIVAHDLRNPLGAITISASLLQNECDAARARERAATIANIAMRMEYLIKTMLDVATMEAGRFSLVPASCRVEELLAEVIELFQPLARSKAIALELRSVPDLTIHADRERVLQVFSNLVGNALKFTPREGKVTLSAEQHGDEARFAVIDTGPGISRSHLPHVFDRFWGDMTPGVKSTGLGLYIARVIVTAHGGRIWVKSEPGHGAAFYFTLPLEQSSSVPTARSVARQRPWGT
jgi:signal transduction histidine kinase